MPLIKVISPLSPGWLEHQIPTKAKSWGECTFTFDQNCSNYDWLVVYEDLGPAQGLRKNERSEKLGCQNENTILFTSEPDSIKYYGDSFVKQFGHIFTSQRDWALSHPVKIYTQPSLAWMIGVSHHNANLTFEETLKLNIENKSKEISLIMSNKTMGHTMHKSRFNCLSYLSGKIKPISIFGRTPNALPLNDKKDALTPFKYTIALENHKSEHHWTEKIADAFIAGTLPFYDGATNINSYFPPESFIQIDMTNPSQSLDIINEALDNKEYEKRKEAILHSRELVIKKYNLFAVVNDYIRGNPIGISKADDEILSRHAIRSSSLKININDHLNKIKAKIFSRINNQLEMKNRN